MLPGHTPPIESAQPGEIVAFIGGAPQPMRQISACDSFRQIRPLKRRAVNRPQPSLKAEKHAEVVLDSPGLLARNLVGEKQLCQVTGALREDQRVVQS